MDKKALRLCVLSKKGEKNNVRQKKFSRFNEDTLAIGDLLTPQAGEGKGILAKTGAESADMKWQVVKIYTMPDEQKGVKIMRIA